MRLILIRHGRSEANAQQLLAGRAPGVELDATGREQAEALAPPLAALELAAAYHSPIRRCEHTAILAGLSDAQPFDGLTECDYGQWTNRALPELAEEPLWKQIQERPSTVRFPDGESMAEMNQRVLAAVTELNRRHPGSDLVVAVTHGDPIKAIVANALAMDFDEFQRLHIAPGSISIIDYAHDKPFVLCVNGEGTALAQLAVQTPAVGGGDSPKV